MELDNPSRKNKYRTHSGRRQKVKREWADGSEMY